MYKSATTRQMNRQHGLSQFTSSSDVYIPATLALEKAIDHFPVPVLGGGLHEQPTREDVRLSSAAKSTDQQLQHVDSSMLFFPTIRWSDSGADISGKGSSSSSSSYTQSLKKRHGGVTSTNDSFHRSNKVARKTPASFSCKKTKELRRAKKHLLRCMSVQSRLNLMGLETSLHYQNKQNNNNHNINNGHNKNILQDLFLAPIFLLPTTVKEESGTSTNDDVNDWSYNVVG